MSAVTAAGERRTASLALQRCRWCGCRCRVGRVAAGIGEGRRRSFGGPAGLLPPCLFSCCFLFFVEGGRRRRWGKGWGRSRAASAAVAVSAGAVGAVGGGRRGVSPVDRATDAVAAAAVAEIIRALATPPTVRKRPPAAAAVGGGPDPRHQRGQDRRRRVPPFRFRITRSVFAIASSTSIADAVAIAVALGFRNTGRGFCGGGGVGTSSAVSLRRQRRRARRGRGRRRFCRRRGGNVRPLLGVRPSRQLVSPEPGESKGRRTQRMLKRLVSVRVPRILSKVFLEGARNERTSHKAALVEQTGDEIARSRESCARGLRSSGVPPVREAVHRRNGWRDVDETPSALGEDDCCSLHANPIAFAPPYCLGRNGSSWR